jgi:large subunit ribosomal protein L25
MAKNAKTIELKANTRSKAGSAYSRRLRKEGFIPCVVYNSKGKSELLQLQMHTLEMLIQHSGGQNIIIDLGIDGKKNRKVLLKELQHNPVSDEILHADFLEISMTQKVKITVNIELEGEPVGVTQEDGVLEHSLRSIEVECLPADIIEECKVDVSNLHMGESIFVSDIELDPKITVITPGDQPVAAVHKPHIVEEEVPEAAEGEEGEAAEGEGEKPETEKGENTREKEESKKDTGKKDSHKKE